MRDSDGLKGSIYEAEYVLTGVIIDNYLQSFEFHTRGHRDEPGFKLWKILICFHFIHFRPEYIHQYVLPFLITENFNSHYYHYSHNYDASVKFTI